MMVKVIDPFRLDHSGWKDCWAYSMSRKTIGPSKRRRYSVQTYWWYAINDYINIECGDKKLYQVYSPVDTQVQVPTQIHFRPQAANEALQEYIQRLTDLVMHATYADLTSVMCQVTIIFFIRHLFNKEIKNKLTTRPLILLYKWCKWILQ